MFPMMELFEQSDLSRNQFCEQMDLSVHSFNYWLNKYRKSKMALSGGSVNKEFMELKVVAPSAPMGNMRISYSNGTVIELPIG